MHLRLSTHVVNFVGGSSLVGDKRPPAVITVLITADKPSVELLYRYGFTCSRAAICYLFSTSLYLARPCLRPLPFFAFVKPYAASLWRYRDISPAPLFATLRNSALPGEDTAAIERHYGRSWSTRQQRDIWHELALGQGPAWLCTYCAPIQGAERQPGLRASHCAVVDLLLGVRVASSTVPHGPVSALNSSR
jgi:hypothetical protein